MFCFDVMYVSLLCMHNFSVLLWYGYENVRGRNENKNKFRPTFQVWRAEKIKIDLFVQFPEFSLQWIC